MRECSNFLRTPVQLYNTEEEAQIYLSLRKCMTGWRMMSSAGMLIAFLGPKRFAKMLELHRSQWDPKVCWKTPLAILVHSIAWRVWSIKTLARSRCHVGCVRSVRTLRTTSTRRTLRVTVWTSARRVPATTKHHQGAIRECDNRRICCR